MVCSLKTYSQTNKNTVKLGMRTVCIKVCTAVMMVFIASVTENAATILEHTAGFLELQSQSIRLYGYVSRTYYFCTDEHIKYSGICHQSTVMHINCTEMYILFIFASRAVMETRASQQKYLMSVPQGASTLRGHADRIRKCTVTVWKCTVSS